MHTLPSGDSGRGRNVALIVVFAFLLWFVQIVTGALGGASAATPLNVFVGYMDTHSGGFSVNQPTPWPYTDPTSYSGSPCPAYPNDTTCWDASAVRLDNPGNTDVTGVQPVVVIGSSTYGFWGSNVTVKAHGSMVLTETGGQNSTNFDGSDYSPNAYNGGNFASCANSGAIPTVQITIAGVTTKYLDSGQVLNGGGVDSGHCLSGSFVAGRMDESHPWVQIGSGTQTAPSVPQSVAATGGSGSVSLSWTAPTDDGGSAITGYNVYRGTAANAEASAPIATNVAGLSYTDNGVTNGTKYYYKIAAVNAVGTSAQSNEVSATPQAVQATVPSAPRTLTGIASNSSVKLSWLAPTSNGGSPITGYSVYRGTSAGGESATPLATNVTATTFTDTSAVNGSTYFYTVAAVNAIGPSAPSNEISALPQATAPSSPLNLVASGGSGLVSLSWTAPTTDGGSGITGYNIYRGTSAAGEAVVPVASSVGLTSFTDTGLANGTTYFYKVAAVNSVGTSPLSNEASATPQPTATVPSAPSALTAQSGNGFVSLSWTAPTSTGGATITGYNVYRGAAPNAESTTPVATNVNRTSYVDNGLVNGTTYYYRVAAVNAVGTSPQSSEAAGLPAATAPSSPQSVVTTGGNSSVAVAWSAPTSDGGSPVTGYNVYRGTVANGESSTPVASGLSTTGFTDTGLTNGTTYFYKVAAVNSVGTSVLSTESSATPQAPQATSYVRRIGSATASTASSSSVFAVGPLAVAAGHTVVISSMLSSTSITGAVSATDSAGNSYVLARDVNDGSAGDRVVTLIALSVKAVGAGGTITLTHPSSGETHAAVDEYAGATAIDTSAGASATGSAFTSGSSPVTSQGNELLIGVLGTESGSSPAWSTGWTALPALAVSTDYLGTAYRIVTTTGSYAASGASGGQWMAGIVTLKAGAVTATAPSSPQGVTATAGNTTVQLSWTPPTSTGGSPITSYNIYRGTASNGEASTPIASNPTTSYTDTTLTNGTTYYYKITALNNIGASAPSAETSATPQAAPTGSAFVRRVGSTTAAAATTTNTLTVGSPGVAGVHTLVISMLLSSTSVTGAVSAQDTNGNTYVIARDINDGSAGDRTVLMVAVNVKALTAGMTISVSHPSAAQTHLTADEYAGVTGLDTSAGASASAASFSSGNTPATSQANEVLIGVVGIESGKTPVWSTGWAALAPLSVSSDYLGTAYRIVTASGAYAATGTSGGQWMAGIVALKTG